MSDRVGSEDRDLQQQEETPRAETVLGDDAVALEAIAFAHDSLAAFERTQDVWADALRHFVDVTPATIDHEIDRALVRAGRFAEVDRAYVFQHSADRRTLVLTHEWTSPGAENQSESLTQIDDTVLPDFLSRLVAGDEVYVPDVRELGEDARIEHVVLASHGVVACLIMPMIHHGNFVGFVGFDSTERIRYWTSEHRSTLRFVADLFAGALERTRVERQNRVLSRALEQSPTGVAIYDTGGSVEWVNEAFEHLSGHSRETLVDRRSGANPFGLRDPDTLNDMLATVLAGGVWTTELDMPNAADRHVVVRLTMFAVDEHDMAASKIVCLLEDVTGQVEAQRDLEEAKSEAELASEAKSRFLTTMSHEIRAPMNTIIGNIELLEDTPVSKPQRELLESLDSASEQLLHIVDDAVDLSRIESGDVDVGAEPIDVRALLDDVAASARAEQGSSATQLRIRVAESVPRTILGDETLLRQVLTNLTSNAIAFTPNGLVELESTVLFGAKAPALVLRVADTGAGIEPSRLPTIFEPHESDDLPGHVTGLGLSISRRLVEAMGGEISVDSQVGSGTTFTVKLPLETAEEAEPVAATAPSAPRPPAQMAAPLGSVGAPGVEPPDAEPATQRGLRVLVADDSEDSIRIVEAFLRPVSECIDAAHNGVEALACMNARHYDIVLMDMQMPKMDGYAATQAIRVLGDPIAADTPIVALTAYALAEEIGRAISAGCDGYLTKPIRRADLMRIVERYARAPIG